MMIQTRAAAVLLATALLAACGGDSGREHAGAVLQFQVNGNAVGSVNGVELPGALLNAVAERHGLDPTQAEQRAQAVKSLSNYILLAQQADKLGVYEQPDLVARVEAARLRGMAQAVLVAYRRAHPITDQMVADDYARQLENVGDLTYGFTQLLFNSHVNAAKAAAALANGASFGEVYNQWHDKVVDAQRFTGVFPRQVPDSLGRALVAMQPGQTTPEPIHSKLGWHLLHLDSTENFEPPPLDKVKERVRRDMEEKQANAWVHALHADAVIEISPDARTVPVSEADRNVEPKGVSARPQVLVNDKADGAATSTPTPTSTSAPPVPATKPALKPAPASAGSSA